MTEKRENNNQIDPSLMDTQRLLLGVELPEDMSFDLDDILAEFGGAAELIPEKPPVPEPGPESVPEPVPAPPPDSEPAPAPELPPEPSSPAGKSGRRFFRRPRPEEPPEAAAPEPSPPPEEPPGPGSQPLAAQTDSRRTRRRWILLSGMILPRRKDCICRRSFRRRRMSPIRPLRKSCRKNLRPPPFRRSRLPSPWRTWWPVRWTR